jgi:hypothetical protein
VNKPGATRLATAIPTTIAPSMISTVARSISKLPFPRKHPFSPQ